MPIWVVMTHPQYFCLLFVAFVTIIPTALDDHLLSMWLPFECPCIAHIIPVKNQSHSIEGLELLHRQMWPFSPRSRVNLFTTKTVLARNALLRMTSATLFGWVGICSNAPEEEFPKRESVSSPALPILINKEVEDSMIQMGTTKQTLLIEVPSTCCDVPWVWLLTRICISDYSCHMLQYHLLLYHMLLLTAQFNQNYTLLWHSDCNATAVLACLISGCS